MAACVTTTPTGWQEKLQQGDPALLRPDLERLAGRYPDQPDWEALALQAAYKVDGATPELCNRLADLRGVALTIKPPLSMDACYFVLGMQAKKKRDIRSMVRWFRRIDPDTLDEEKAKIVWPLLFRSYLRQAAWSKARQFALLAIGTAPGNPGLHLDLGKVYEQSGELQRAANEYELTVALQPNLAEAQEGLHRVQGIIEARGVSQKGSIGNWHDDKKVKKNWSITPMGKEMMLQRLEVDEKMAAPATGEIAFVWHRLLAPGGFSAGWMRQHVARVVANAGRCGWPTEELRMFLERDARFQLPDKFLATVLGRCWQKRLRLGIDPELIGGYASFSFRHTRARR